MQKLLMRFYNKRRNNMDDRNTGERLMSEIDVVILAAVVIVGYFIVYFYRGG